MRSDNEDELAPAECKREACQIQTCIAKHFTVQRDPVAYCRPYYDRYTECVRQYRDKKEKGAS